MPSLLPINFISLECSSTPFSSPCNRIFNRLWAQTTRSVLEDQKLKLRLKRSAAGLRTELSDRGRCGRTLEDSTQKNRIGLLRFRTDLSDVVAGHWRSGRTSSSLTSGWLEHFLALDWKQWFDIGLDDCHGLDLPSVNEMTDDREPRIDNVDGSNWPRHSKRSHASSHASKVATSGRRSEWVSSDGNCCCDGSVHGFDGTSLWFFWFVRVVNCRCGVLQMKRHCRWRSEEARNGATVEARHTRFHGRRRSRRRAGQVIESQLKEAS